MRKYIFASLFFLSFYVFCEGNMKVSIEGKYIESINTVYIEYVKDNPKKVNSLEYLKFEIEENKNEMFIKIFDVRFMFGGNAMYRIDRKSKKIIEKKYFE